jgi:hypothetical protein
VSADFLTLFEYNTVMQKQKYQNLKVLSLEQQLIGLLPVVMVHIIMCMGVDVAKIMGSRSDDWIY